MGHGALGMGMGMGHGALGIGHWALGIGHWAYLTKIEKGHNYRGINCTDTAVSKECQLKVHSTVRQGLKQEPQSASPLKED